MPDLHFGLLPEERRPLLNKFYREHQSSMRAANKGQAWIAQQQELVGALCLTAVNDGQWLTGLFVAPQWRGQGVAGRLIEAALTGTQGPVWLFCHPDLLSLYQPLGFAEAKRLPAALGERFMRYSRSKALLALCREPE